MGGLDEALAHQTERSGERATSVLVARVAGNTHPSDRSKGARIRCLDALMQAAEISGGRVLRRQRDALLVLLRNPDAAVAAATRMQAYTAKGGSAGAGVRIGVASGRLRQRNGEVLGDAVDLALRVSGLARTGQILTSQDTAAQLSPAMQSTLGGTDLVDEQTVVREIRWRDKAIELLAIHKESGSRRPHTFLRLQFGGTTILRRREVEYVSLGRDPASHIVVTHRLVSRHHCTISREASGFVLQDHSRNGTFVVIGAEGETFVHSEAAPLGKEGWISLGVSADECEQVIQYQTLLAA